MAHTFSCLHYHVVFSTAGRQNLIPQDKLQHLHAYINGIIENLGGESVAIGGTTNHVHILMSLVTDLPVSKAVNVIKSNSSKWLHESFSIMASFAWQSGYSAFTVSKSNLKAVMDYVNNQPSHHGTMEYQQEIKTLLQRHGIDYDTDALFDNA